MDFCTKKFFELWNTLLAVKSSFFKEEFIGNTFKLQMKILINELFIILPKKIESSFSMENQEKFKELALLYDKEASSTQNETLKIKPDVIYILFMCNYYQIFFQKFLIYLIITHSILN